MSISLSRYVNINSQVGGQNLLTTRDLLGRLFTGNPLVPPQSFIQFSNPADVGTYFGTTSEEYYRALFYFTWINKNFESPDQIQFARIALAAVAPRVYPFANTASISAIGAWAALTSASLIITLGGVSELFTIDFATAITGGPVASYADVATAITEALVAQGSGAAFTSAVVTYVASGQNPGFHFVGGATGAATISISPGTTGQDITGASWLAWYPGETYFLNNLFTQTAYATNAIWANGSNAETTTACLTASADYSNNFGSFLFLNNLGLTLGQINAAALWNQTQNVEFLYTIPVLPANVANWTNPTFTVSD